uniref:DUF7588 domain-containing protein n=1 Tax=Vitis vinifera TaxID=29760 RepID=A5B384_VITVI|nr:hypothetical protein VITISV_036746 [Vitis vinifera]
MSISLEQDDQVIRLLDSKPVEKNKKDHYNFIHFGMIQVVAKPLTRLGLNTSIIMCLRDNRHLDYQDSIIGAVQAGLNDGPIYFQCFLNFTVRLRDVDILEFVVLHVKTHDFKFKQGNSPVSIITSNPRISDYEPSRASSSSIPVRTTRKEEGSSSANPKNIKLTGIRNHTNLARPFYTEENESTQKSHQDESPDMSPMYSQMINTISFNDKDFEINKNLLREDFYFEANKKRKDWFFSIVPKDIRTLYQEEFYAYLRQEKKNIKFWIWFELFKQEEYPDYPCKRINNTSTKAKIWVTNDHTDKKNIKLYEFSKEF